MSEPAFPGHGARWPELERRLVGLRAADPEPARGWPDLLWPVIPDAAFMAARDAQALFAHTNGFIATPAVVTLEAEVRSMVREILRVPEAGETTITVGGTESNYLAMRAARTEFRAAGHTGVPKVVIPQTAHPSFDKAASDLDMEVVRVAPGADYRADPAAIEAAIDERTCLIAASAPCYPFGVVDPIPALGEIALAREVWLHVDACVGGFLLPFFRRLGVLRHEFDFAVPGVRSMSADLHKFGYCLNGISTFSVRDAELVGRHSFELPAEGWLYRRYYRAGFTGTRAGGTMAAAWATLNALGEEGYLASAKLILAAAERLRAGIERIDGIRLMAPHEGGVVVIETDEPELKPGAVAEAMRRSDWPVRAVGAPERIWFLLSPLPAECFDPFLLDLAAAVDLCRRGEIAEPTHIEGYGTQ
jgi:sphinganine-1-phosphate aldolase